MSERSVRGIPAGSVKYFGSAMGSNADRHGLSGTGIPERGRPDHAAGMEPVKTGPSGASGNYRRNHAVNMELVEEIRSDIIRGLDRAKEITDDEMMELITEAVFSRSNKEYLDIAQKRELADMVFNSIRRFDILQPMLEDKSITEIMVNGPDHLFIEKNGRIERLDMRFGSSEKLEDVIQAILSRTNRSVNEASPIVDITLPDGSRVNVVLKPIALNGPIMTIRKFPEKPMTMEQLVKADTISPEAAEDLECLVRARYNIFICGGTGSGKTTFLNALSCFIPCDERIITIEDSAELQIKSIDNIVRLETRNANSEGRGRVTMRELIKTSLRMRPERIIVGEVRGEEALDMLQAMNTGHDGSLSTGHANSAADMLNRLETMVLGAAALPLEAIRQQIASAIDIIVHMARLRDKSRRVVEISEIEGYRGGQIQLNPLYIFKEGRPGIPDQNFEDAERGENRTTGEIWEAVSDGFMRRREQNGNRVIGHLRRTGNCLVKTGKLDMAGIACKLRGG